MGGSITEEGSQSKCKESRTVASQKKRDTEWELHGESGETCDKRMLILLKEAVYKITIRSVSMSGSDH